MQKTVNSGLLFGLILMSSHASAVDPRIEALGNDLETVFRAQTGLGFRAFDCDFDPDAGPPAELECDAEDDEGDRFIYRLWLSAPNEDATAVMWQPVDQLEAQGFAWLRAPVDQFMAAFINADWPALEASYYPGLAEALSPATENMLSRMRAAASPISGYEPLLYSSTAPGVHALEVRINGEQQSLVGRFRVREDSQGLGKLSAFLILPEPGSDLANQTLRDMAVQMLSRLFGQPVTQLDLPFDALRRTGDSAQGEVRLADGSLLAVRGEQKSPSSDFDNNDYAFQVLEAAWIIEDHLIRTGKDGAEVSCPERIVSDGGRLFCTIREADGTELRVELRRRAGEHRMGPPKPVQ